MRQQYDLTNYFIFVSIKRQIIRGVLQQAVEMRFQGEIIDNWRRQIQTGVVRNEKLSCCCMRFLTSFTTNPRSRTQDIKIYDTGPNSTRSPLDH